MVETQFDLNKEKTDLIGFIKRLWSINRSITGNGLRETLEIVKQYLPCLKISEVPTGTKVLDWTVPDEWEIKEAYIEDAEGNRIADFSNNNLHLVGYSVAINKKIRLEDLKNHLYTLPDKPNAIPYVTSYYQEHWGFCITENEKQKLKDGTYKVLIDARHFKGSLSYGDLLIKGKSKKEVFISTYCCHPSMANNELSGPCVAVALAQWLMSKQNLEYSYRFVFAPETIGAAAYLENNLDHLKTHVIAAFNLTCVGDERDWSYLPSRLGNTYADKVALHALKNYTTGFKKYTWSDRGSDEKMYCAPFIDLPMVSVMRSKHGTYPEYHTSLDAIGEVVTEKGLSESLNRHKKMIEIIERDCLPVTRVMGEPQLGKRGLYPSVSHNGSSESVRLRLNVISYADGNHSLLDIAEKCNASFFDVLEEFEILQDSDVVGVKI